MRHVSRFLALVAWACLLASCASTRKAPSDHGSSDPYAHVPDGQLYAPGVRDGTPDVAHVDVWAIPEPVPMAEPRARYGNHSPYKVLGKVYHVLDDARDYKERGIASWYGAKFHSRPTSSMEPYDVAKLTAAHKTLPLPSYVRVTNLDNGRSLVVRVNDRGPFAHGRIIDLSYAAAVRLGVDKVGTAPVEVEALVPDGHHRVTNSAPPVATAPLASTDIRWPTTRGSIQVASFSDKDNAQRLLQRLEDADIPRADIQSARVNGQRVYRVVVGALKTSRLQQAYQSLLGMGMRGMRVLTEE